MECCCSALPFSQPSFFSPKHIRNRASGSCPWNQKEFSTDPFLYTAKRWFGEASPEAKAAKNIHNFFTYIAVRIVAAQLESYNPEAYEELTEFMGRNSLNDGDKFCASLMRESSRHKSLALRILEVRSSYCQNDFEWDNMKRLAFKMVEESNTKLMRNYIVETSHLENET